MLYLYLIFYFLSLYLSGRLYFSLVCKPNIATLQVCESKLELPGTIKVDASERYTVRNLRIREDTAKYLRNLDPNSAHYDPKTRYGY